MNFPALDDLLSLPQVVGYLATVISIGAYGLKDDFRFRAGIGASLLAWAAHYSLLDAWTAAGTCLLIASRQGVTLLMPNMTMQARKWTSLTYAAAFTAVLGWTWTGPISLLPWLAALNATYAYVYLTGARLRGQVMASTGCWLVNAVLIGSVGNVVTNIATLSMTSWALLRMRRAAAAT